MKIDDNKVTVGQLIEGLQRMIRNRDICPEDPIDWVESIDTNKDVARSAKEGYCHPIGTILLHISPVNEEEPGIASFEPKRSSKYWS